MIPKVGHTYRDSDDNTAKILFVCYITRMLTIRAHIRGYEAGRIGHICKIPNGRYTGTFEISFKKFREADLRSPV